MSEHRSSDHAQVAYSLVLVVLVVFAGLALVARWAGAAVFAARAQTSADAAALGTALGGERSGRSVAGEVDQLTLDRSGTYVTARTSVGGQRGEATAIAQITSARRRSGLAPSMVAALSRAEQLLGRSITISSGYRSTEHQRRLWEERDTNPYPVATPGTSLHERGLAVDVALSQVSAVLSVAAHAGLCHPLPEIDPVHFVVCPIPD